MSTRIEFAEKNLLAFVIKNTFSNMNRKLSNKFATFSHLNGKIIFRANSDCRSFDCITKTLNTKGACHKLYSLDRCCMQLTYSTKSILLQPISRRAIKTIRIDIHSKHTQHKMHYYIIYLS